MKRSTLLVEISIVVIAVFILASAIGSPPITSVSATNQGVRSDIINDWLARPVGTVPVTQAQGPVKEFTLDIRQIDHEITPGVTVKAWAFGLPGEEPTVPGPEIRVNEGDLVRITLRNTDILPHSIHPHGITSLAQSMDGVPATSLQLMPNEEYTYEFVATNPGTHVYHCHVQTFVHMDMGMYGALVVEPKESQSATWDREYTLILDEWDSKQNPHAPVHRPEYDYFLINGKSYPATEALEILPDEVGLIRLINMGFEDHSMHLHGNDFLVVAKDGQDLPSPYMGDTLHIAPGERYDILVKGRDGTFPFHDHYVQNVTNAGVYPGGILTLIKGGPAKAARPGEEPQARPISADPGVGGGGHESHAATTPKTNEQSDSRKSVSNGDVLEGSVDVKITNLAYDAERVRVKVGTTVTWTNLDQVPHTVTAGKPQDPPESRAFDSSNGTLDVEAMIGFQESWSYTFTEPGVYEYFCLPHPFMIGYVEVVE